MIILTSLGATHLPLGVVLAEGNLDFLAGSQRNVSDRVTVIGMGIQKVS